VATLVAREASPAEVFGVVAQEVARSLDIPMISVVKFDNGGSATQVGAWGAANPFPVGLSWTLDGTGVAALVAETARPARLHDYAEVPGGIAAVLAREAGIRSAVGVPAGLGEPVFDKLKADLAKALFSLPAVLGVEYGSGFACATMRGSVHNDPFVLDPAAAAPVAGGVPRVRTSKNHHGGMLGGISSGMPIVLRAAVKPTSSLPRPQDTVNRQGEATTVRTTGRHDPCLLPRFIPMGEAMVALVLADHYLRQRSQSGNL